MRTRLLLPAVAWAGVIFFLSSLESPPGQGGEVQAYAAHLFVYAVLALLTARYVAGQWPALGSWGPAAAWAVAVAYGASDEFHQAFVPGRDANVTDWLFDAGGAAAGALLFELRVRPGRR